MVSRLLCARRALRVRRAQTSLEYVAILALVLAVLLPLGYFAYQDVQAKNAVSQAEIVVARLAAAADLVYVQGPSARTQVQVYVPKYVNNASVGNREILYSVFAGGALTDVYRSTQGNVAGVLPVLEGVYVMDVYVNETNWVIINYEGSELPSPTGVPTPTPTPSPPPGQCPAISYLNVSTWKNASYDIPKYVFSPAEVVEIIGGNWLANSSVTLDVKGLGNVSVSGYPKLVLTNSTGYFTDSFFALGLPAGNYSVYANDSARARTYFFNVTDCST